MCPGGTVHAAGEKLCSACHRPADDDTTFVHLSQDRVRRAAGFVVQLRGTGKLPPVLVNDFLPSSACLCRRADCFYAFLADLEKSIERRVCVDCGGTNARRKPTRWYRLAAEDDKDNERGVAGLFGAGSWCCRACYARRRGNNKNNSTTTSQAPPVRNNVAPDAAAVVVSGMPTEKAAVRVRYMVERALGHGQIVFWEDAAGWLEDERAKDGYEKRLTTTYKRRVMKSMFHSIVNKNNTTGNSTTTNANAGGGSSKPSWRLVCCTDRGRGCSHGEDARRRRLLLFLLPDGLRDEVIVEHVFQAARDVNVCAGPPSATPAGGRAFLKAVLDRVFFDKEDADVRTAVVRAVGRLVRADT